MSKKRKMDWPKVGPFTVYRRAEGGYWHIDSQEVKMSTRTRYLKRALQFAKKVLDQIEAEKRAPDPYNEAIGFCPVTYRRVNKDYYCPPHQSCKGCHGPQERFDDADTEAIAVERIFKAMLRITRQDLGLKPEYPKYQWKIWAYEWVYNCPSFKVFCDYVGEDVERIRRYLWSKCIKNDPFFQKVIDPETLKIKYDEEKIKRFTDDDLDWDYYTRDSRNERKRRARAETRARQVAG